MSYTARPAQLADRTAMRSLLITPVNGTSPYDEIMQDWGPEASSLTVADFRTMLENGMRVLVSEDDATKAMAGWNCFLPGNRLPQLGIAYSGPAWESFYTVTDKSLVALERLRVFWSMLKFGAAHVDPSVYIYGSVIPTRRLDQALSGVFQSVPDNRGGVACVTYYAPEADILAARAP